MYDFVPNYQCMLYNMMHIHNLLNVHKGVYITSHKPPAIQSDAGVLNLTTTMVHAVTPLLAA